VAGLSTFLLLAGSAVTAAGAVTSSGCTGFTHVFTPGSYRLDLRINTPTEWTHFAVHPLARGRTIVALWEERAARPTELSVRDAWLTGDNPDGTFELIRRSHLARGGYILEIQTSVPVVTRLAICGTQKFRRSAPSRWRVIQSELGSLPVSRGASLRIDGRTTVALIARRTSTLGLGTVIGACLKPAGDLPGCDLAAGNMFVTPCACGSTVWTYETYTAGSMPPGLAVPEVDSATVGVSPGGRLLEVALTPP
jgi:hypothetical protein